MAYADYSQVDQERQVRLMQQDDRDARRARLEEIGDEPIDTQKPFTLMPDYLDAEQALEILPFLEAFAHGRPVWEWHADRRRSARGQWKRAELLPLRTRVDFLSLTYRDDSPNDGTQRACGPEDAR